VRSGSGRDHGAPAVQVRTVPRWVLGGHHQLRAPPGRDHQARQHRRGPEGHPRFGEAAAPQQRRPVQPAEPDRPVLRPAHPEHADPDLLHRRDRRRLPVLGRGLRVLASLERGPLRLLRRHPAQRRAAAHHPKRPAATLLLPVLGEHAHPQPDPQVLLAARGGRRRGHGPAGHRRRRRVVRQRATGRRSVRQRRDERLDPQRRRTVLPHGDPLPGQHDRLHRERVGVHLLPHLRQRHRAQHRRRLLRHPATHLGHVDGQHH
jgi:hypothetical protein